VSVGRNKIVSSWLTAKINDHWKQTEMKILLYYEFYHGISLDGVEIHGAVTPSAFLLSPEKNTP
jgi:hypothetical protein